MGIGYGLQITATYKRLSKNYHALTMIVVIDKGFWEGIVHAGGMTASLIGMRIKFS